MLELEFDKFGLDCTVGNVVCCIAGKAVCCIDHCEGVFVDVGLVQFWDKVDVRSFGGAVLVLGGDMGDKTV